MKQVSSLFFIFWFSIHAMEVETDLVNGKDFNQLLSMMLNSPLRECYSRYRKYQIWQLQRTIQGYTPPDENQEESDLLFSTAYNVIGRPIKKKIKRVCAKKKVLHKKIYQVHDRIVASHEMKESYIIEIIAKAAKDYAITLNFLDEKTPTCTTFTFSPLMICAALGYQNATKALLHSGADSTARTFTHRTALTEALLGYVSALSAVSWGNKKIDIWKVKDIDERYHGIIKMLLKNNKFLLDPSSDTRIDPIGISIHYGLANVLQIFMKKWRLPTLTQIVTQEFQGEQPLDKTQKKLSDLRSALISIDEKREVPFADFCFIKQLFTFLTQLK